MQSKWITRTGRVMTVMLVSLLFILPAHAQEQSAEAPAEKAPAEAAVEQTTTIQKTALSFPVAFRYQPDYCDFTAAFPEQPIISERCDVQGDPKTCYKLVSFTKVFDMASTVNINVICNPGDNETYEYFNQQMMEDTVRRMTQSTVIETYNVNSAQKEGYRLSGLVGQGRKGLHDTLYIAQLWVSENSIMSVEAEISGQTMAAADTLFAGILNNIGYAKELLPQSATPKAPVPQEPAAQE